MRFRRDVRDWVVKAEEDYAVVHTLQRRRKPVFNDSVCFHAQQPPVSNCCVLRLNISNHLRSICDTQANLPRVPRLSGPLVLSRMFVPLFRCCSKAHNDQPMSSPFSFSRRSLGVTLTAWVAIVQTLRR